MRDLGDRGAQGRACGNLGNTFYLLGNFQGAIEHHQERLKIAKEFGDKVSFHENTKFVNYYKKY
jgi:hypothetical protein